MAGYDRDDQGNVSIVYRDPNGSDPEQTFTLNGLGSFYSKNPKAKDFKLSFEDKTASELSDVEVTNGIKNSQETIQKGEHQGS